METIIDFDSFLHISVPVTFSYKCKWIDKNGAIW